MSSDDQQPEKMLPVHGTDDPPATTPTVKTVAEPAKPKADEPVKDDAYAQALLSVTTAEFNERQATKPHEKHLFTRKMLIYLAISLAITIALWVAVTIFGHKSKTTTDTSAPSQAQQTIQGAQNLNNPNAYQ